MEHSKSSTINLKIGRYFIDSCEDRAQQVQSLKRESTLQVTDWGLEVSVFIHILIGIDIV